MTTSQHASTEKNWYLPRLNGGEDKGLNDAGISNFKGSQHLARETVQNIVDAHDPQSNGNAIAEFELLDVPTESLPGIETFEAIHSACAARVQEDFAASSSDDNAQVQFMDYGTSLLQQPSIPVLRIRDLNTVGLQGDDNQRSSRWYRLIRGQGTPNKEGASAGTYGIGQRAPFAFSGLRMVLYSTMLADGEVRFMGKFILCSCNHPSDQYRTQNIGYFGMLTGDENAPVESICNRDDIPIEFQRDTPGTDIFIIGFTQSDLAQSVTHAILSDFYAAIHRGKIEVTIKEPSQKPFVIRADTIEEILARNEHKMRRADRRTAMYSLQALRDTAGSGVYTKHIENLGTVSLYITRDTEATNSIAYMRAPLIKVEQKGSAKLQDYQAVLIVDSHEGNDFLSRLEDPSHSRWHEDELGSSASREEKSAARAARLALLAFVRDTLSDIRGSSDNDSEDIPELAKLLPLEDEDEPVEQSTEEGTVPTDQTTDSETAQLVNPPEPVAVTVTPVPSQPATTRPEPSNTAGEGTGATGGGGEDGEGGGDGLGGEGDGTGGGTGESGGNQLGGVENKPVNLGFRSWRIGNLESQTYRLVLSADQDTAGSLLLIALGERGEYPVNIDKAQDLETGEEFTCSNGKIEGCVISSEKQRRLEVTIDVDVDVSLRMEVSS